MKDIDSLVKELTDNLDNKDINSILEKIEYLTSQNNILNNILYGVVTIDRDGFVDGFNLTFENLLGYSKEELLEKNIKSLFLNYDGLIGIGKKVLGLKKDSSTIPLDLSFSQTTLNDKEIFIGVVRDRREEIDKKEELKESQEKLQSILDNVYEGIITINPKGTIDSYNKSSEKIFGYSLDEVLGKNVNMLMPEPYHKEHDGYLRNYMQGGEAKIIGIGREVQGKRKDGVIFPLYLAVTEIKREKGILFVGVVRDLTEQKRFDTLKNEFVSTVSHELRTPLTSIRGSLSLIDSGAMGEVSPKISPLLKIALKNSERLILLINDILDIEKIESGKMEFELSEIEINEILNNAIESNDGYAKLHNVSLSFTHIAKNIIVYVDGHRIHQVLSNLLSNAIKFSPTNEEVKVLVKENIEENIVRVEVIDKGAGIPEEFRDRIFQKFAQADSSDTKQKGGTGLGLSITKAIIEKFGGNIGFNCPKEGGTIFYFELPIVEDFEIIKSEKSDYKAKVLIVEDNKDIVPLLKHMLEQENIDSDIAYSASKAKELLLKNKYDAMTLDIMLPDKDGITLLKEIREDINLQKLLIIIISATAIQTKDKEEMSVEVVNWINKPINPQIFINSLNKVLEGKEKSRYCILHLEDDEDIASFVKVLLSDIGDIELVKNINQAKKVIPHKMYDLIILDVTLPDGTGDTLVPFIKEQQPFTPIVFFSAQEVDNSLKHQVKSALVKSKTSNELFINTIKKMLK